jgi:hypothetical protein
LRLGPFRLSAAGRNEINQSNLWENMIETKIGAASFIQGNIQTDGADKISQPGEEKISW